MATAPWVTTRPPIKVERKKLTPEQLARRAELKRIRYRTDPEFRMRCINRSRGQVRVRRVKENSDG